MFIVQWILNAGIHGLVELVLGIFGMRKPDTVGVTRNEKVINDPSVDGTLSDLGL
jgi:hypothetical protein